MLLTELLSSLLLTSLYFATGPNADGTETKTDTEIEVQLPPSLPGSDDLASTPQWPRVYGGQAATTCEWPQAIAFNNCSGTLVHPQMVLYAAHCGTNKTNIRFGTSVNSPARTVAVDYCSAHPQANGQVNTYDYAYCRLAQPVMDVDPTPPAMGCELDEIQAGMDASEVAIVGFGQTNNSGFGTKHWAITTVQSEPYEGNNQGIIGIGEDGKTICFGDSGGSTFWQHPDGSWRGFAITSGIQGSCGTGTGIHILMDYTVPWVEEDSGMDISPCFDTDGNWDPSPACQGFANNPGDGAGSWNNGCSTGQVGGSISTCGPGYDAPPDEDGPTVVITDPLDMAQLEPGDPTDFDVDADDGDGYAVVKVWLRIDGMDQPVEDLEAPWHFTGVAFPKGTYEVEAVAEDWFGNLGVSAPITLYVGEEPPGEEETGGEDETTTGDEESGEDDTGTDEGGGSTGTEDDDEGGTETETTGEPGADDSGDASGCGCRSSGPGGPAGALLLFAGVLAAPRRRT